MKYSIVVAAFLVCCWLQTAIGSVQNDIAMANKAGHAVFLIVTEPGNPDEAKALAIAKEAQTLHPKVVLITMNRADKENKSLVDKYGLAGAPLPAIVVIASNGALAGGALMSEATSEGLIAMIPSQKKADVLKNMQDGKSVFLVVTKKSHQKKEVLGKCRIACSDMNNNASIVEVDFDDASEKRFLSDLKINQIQDEPQTFVINSHGQVTGSFTGTTDAKTLVATAAQKPASGCCPPSSGKACPPPKK